MKSAALVLVGCLMVFVGMGADVWEDCSAWYIAAEDKNGSGHYDSGELVDIRHASDPEFANRGGTRRFNRENISIVTEDVECAVLGRTLPNQKVLYFDGSLS